MWMEGYADGRVWRSPEFRGILSPIVMRSEREILQEAFSPGARRYIASALRETKSSGYFSPVRQTSRDNFVHALRELSAEDEELPLPDDQGPIIFRDGVFQIDVDNAGSPPSIDPALKGLIDSILGT